MFEAAMEYSQLGLSVIPVGRDKRPLVEWAQFQTEAPHQDHLAVWWGQWPEANIGCATGAVSGIVVLDADGPEGLASLKALNTPATTWLSKTGRLEGGWQQFFAHPGAGARIGNRARLKPGLDVRGDGGYVILPPSLHVSGQRYRWLTAPRDLPLAALPEAVLELLIGPAVNGPPREPRGGEVVPEGARNDALYRLARSLHAKGLSSSALTAALLEENRERCRPPLSEREVRAIAHHAGRQGDRPDFGMVDASTAPCDGLGLVQLGELLGESDVGPAWLVDRCLPAGGLGLLAGKPKAGKSTLARRLAFRVGRGEPWLGFSTTQGPVIYLALEEKRQEVRNDFRQLGATREPIFVLCASAPRDALERLRREADRRAPALIIIDPLFRFVRVEDGNDYAIVTAALEPLLTLARETGAHVLAVHHLGKGQSADGDNILGSTAIFAAVDTALLLKRGERYRTLSSIQRYGDDLEEITLDLDPITRDVTAGAPRAEAEAAEAGRLILAALSHSSEPMTEAGLGDSIECRAQVWKRALRALVAGNQITRIGRGGKADPFRYCGSPYIVRNQGT